MIRENELVENDLAERVVRYVLTITNDQFASITVSKLANFFEIDRYRLSRHFKKQKNMTLESFLSKEKMSRAAFLLLADKDMTVKEVSREIGFCTCDYFIRVFREYYGVVPGRYKQFKTERSDIGDRRHSEKDRRKRVMKSLIPKSGDQRNGIKDRRSGKKDRRKQNPAKSSMAEHHFGLKSNTSMNNSDIFRYRELKN